MRTEYSFFRATLSRLLPLDGDLRIDICRLELEIVRDEIGKRGGSRKSRNVGELDTRLLRYLFGIVAPSDQIFFFTGAYQL